MSVAEITLQAPAEGAPYDLVTTHRLARRLADWADCVSPAAYRQVRMDTGRLRCFHCGESTLDVGGVYVHLPAGFDFWALLAAPITRGEAWATTCQECAATMSERDQEALTTRLAALAAETWRSKGA